MKSDSAEILHHHIKLMAVYCRLVSLHIAVHVWKRPSYCALMGLRAGLCRHTGERTSDCEYVMLFSTFFQTFEDIMNVYCLFRNAVIVFCLFVPNVILVCTHSIRMTVVSVRISAPCGSSVHLSCMLYIYSRPKGTFASFTVLFFFHHCIYRSLTAVYLV